MVCLPGFVLRPCLCARLLSQVRGSNFRVHRAFQIFSRVCVLGTFVRLDESCWRGDLEGVREYWEKCRTSGRCAKITAPSPGVLRENDVRRWPHHHFPGACPRRDTTGEFINEPSSNLLQKGFITTILTLGRLVCLTKSKTDFTQLESTTELNWTWAGTHIYTGAGWFSNMGISTI